MALNGLIRQFSSYSDQNLEQMKNDLGIKMPLPKLRACAYYFGKKAFRDPYIEELRFLDLFYETVSTSPVALFSRELLTNDDFVAQTYADLMNKRRELSPNAQKPCTLAELMQLMSGYLARIGKSTMPSPKSLSFEEISLLPGITEAEAMLSTASAKFALRRKEKPIVFFEPTDVLMLLTPTKATSFGERAEAYNSFFAKKETNDLLKSVRLIGKYGILYESLQMSQGINIQTDRLSLDGDEATLHSLITGYHGIYIARVAAASVDTITDSAKAVGLQALPYASVKDPSAVIISRGNKVELFWSAQFIRSFYALTPVSLHLKDECAGELAPIDNFVHQIGRSAYLANSTSEPPYTRVNYAEQVYAISHAAPMGAFFQNALDTALSAIFSLSACGISYSEQSLAINISQPAADVETAAADITSALLGLSRLEAELAIPMAYGTIGFDSTAAAPEITAVAFANGDALPDRATASENRIYCVVPEYTENGIPDFNQLRDLLSWLESVAKTGAFKSARVVCRKSLDEALQEMGGSDFVCIPQSDGSNDQKNLRLALLLESDQDLPLQCVAIVSDVSDNVIVDRTNEFDAEAMRQSFEKECLIFGERQSIVLCADPCDRSAQVLSNELAKRGVAVSWYSTESQPEQIASALLQSQVLIVCDNVSLPTENRFLRFALETCSRANGKILLLGNAKLPKIKNAVQCTDGIFSELLDQIAKKAD